MSDHVKSLWTTFLVSYINQSCCYKHQ